MYKGRGRIPFCSVVQDKSHAFLKYISIKIFPLGLYLFVCKVRVRKVRNNKSYRSRKVRKKYLKKVVDNFGCYPEFPTKSDKLCSFKQASIRKITIRQRFCSDYQVNCDYSVNRRYVTETL
jgi:hypothetical protein